MARLLRDRADGRLTSPLGLLPIAALLILTLLSLLPQTAPPGDYGADKGLHFIGYGGLMGLAVISWARRSWWGWALMLSLAGIGIEFLQALVPERSASLADAISNITGTLLVWAAAEIIYRRLPRTSRG